MSIILPSAEDIYRLVANIQVMKPNVAKPDNSKAQTKLDSLLVSDEYVAEEKIDGCHYTMLSHMFISTDHIDKTPNFPHLVNGFMRLKMPNLILDGEINYPGKTSQYCTRVTGASAETALQFQQEEGNIHYTVFDILRLPNGMWVCNKTYQERRKLLQYLFDNYISKDPELKQYVHLVPMTHTDKTKFKDNILANGGEGVVLKNINSIYIFGKKPMWQWMKIKQSDETDLFIMGFKEPTKLYNGGNFENWPYWKEINGVSRPVTKAYFMGWVGSFILGAMKNGKPIEVCAVSGLSENLLEQVSANRELFMDKVCRVRFMEKTEDGFPRHPTFVNFHETKTKEECTWDF